MSSSQILPLITDKRKTDLIGNVATRASSLMSQEVISLLMMSCYPGKKLEHHLQCHLVFPPCFPGKSAFILLGTWCSCFECFLVGLHVYTWIFGSQIQLASVGPSLSQAAQSVCVNLPGSLRRLISGCCGHRLSICRACLFGEYF